jgi:chromosome segregation ATPase
MEESVMRHPWRYAAMSIGIIPVALLIGGCSAGKEPPAATASPETELRAEVDNLTKRLTEVTTALEQAQRERDELTVSKQDLTARVEQLEREKQAEIEALQSKSAEQATASRNRIRNLNAEIETLQKDIAAKDALGAQKDTEIARLTQSVDELKGQIASLESEKTALTEQLSAAKKGRTMITGILGALLVVSAVTTIVGFSKARKRGGENVLAREEWSGRRVGSA